MSLVLELQQAISSDEKVSKLLTKSYIIATKLDQKDILEWIDLEMNGYKDNSTIPSYRHMPTTYETCSQYHGWTSLTIPKYVIENFKKESARSIFIIEMNQSIKHIEQIHIENIPIRLDTYLTQYFSTQIKPNLQVGSMIAPSNLIEILNHVKNKLLDWALELEKQEILGENMTFTKEEKENASNITINNYGHNSNIQAGGNNNTIESSNNFTVKHKEDLTNQFNKLTELLIEHKEHSNYKNVIDDISYIKNQLSRENVEKNTVSNLWNTLSPAIELLVGGALSGAISGVTAGITQNLLF